MRQKDTPNTDGGFDIDQSFIAAQYFSVF